jgi:hypothetical protein
MPFAYYNKLTRKQQHIYDRSDAVAYLKLPNAEAIQALTAQLQAVLPDGKCTPVQRLCQQISNAITKGLKVESIKIKVLASRPANDAYELHGFYMPAYKDSDHTITVYMRTASRKQVVAFKTFLRTLLHEICHHLDYELLKLEESYHTEGFYKRESSLFHQIVTPSQ